MAEKVFYPTDDQVQICAILHETRSLPKGSVVLAHGISVDKDEDGDSQGGTGAFVELADALSSRNFNVLRFDFRGHGESKDGFKEEDMSISGELRDLTASIEFAERRWSLPMAIVAASFGAVSAAMYAASNQQILSMVLWNPVLDLKKTFLDPNDRSGWAAQSFNEEGFAHLEKHGYMWLDESFKLGRSLIEEMRVVKPYEYLEQIRIPVLTLHGDRDTYVPYGVAKRYAKCNDVSEFVTVPGSEHGFGRSEDRRFIIPRTINWIDRTLPPT